MKIKRGKDLFSRKAGPTKFVWGIMEFIFTVKTLVVIIAVVLLASAGILANGTPQGYKDHDYQKLLAFLELEGLDNKKNGEWINRDGYDPLDPLTWTGVVWNEATEKEITSIGWFGKRVGGYLDVQGCEALEYLDIRSSLVEALNVGGCLSLAKLSCSGAGLAGTLDVSSCPALEELSCYGNELDAINLSDCLSLKELHCGDNNLQTLGLTDCRALKELSCHFNKIQSLDVRACQALESLSCYGNDMVELYAGGCESLEYMNCSDNKLTTLQISGCGALKTLFCDKNSLPSLDLSGAIALERLWCFANNLASIDLSPCPSLTELSCSGNELSTLDLSPCQNIEYLFCASNKLTSLDVSNLKSLISLQCYTNKLMTTLKADGCSALKTLYCYGNSFLADLQVEGCNALSSLQCYSCQLAALNLRDLTNLVELYCEKNSLAILDIVGCSALKDLHCYDNNLTSLDLEGCTKLEDIRCSKNSLVQLDAGGCESLEVLECVDNKLANLNLAGCENLQALYCHENQLTSLNLGGLTKLSRLKCSDNNIASLDISGCEALRYLYCEKNRLTFANLPLPQGFNIYEYHPQKKIPLGREGKIIVGEEVDLASEAMIDGVATLFTWYRVEGEEVEPSSPSAGVFTFGQEFAEDSFYCRLANDTFPPLILTTEDLEVVKVSYAITFIKPTAANDIDNPVNINSGSLLVAAIQGEINSVESMALEIDGEQREILTPQATLYYLLPADLAEGEHTITVKLLDAGDNILAQGSVTFFWERYRRGFGFGRFDFSDL